MLEINDLIAVNASRHPMRKALVTERQEFTYAELQEAVRRVEAELVVRGVGVGTRVGIMLHNGAPFALHLLACLRLGCEVSLFNFRYQGQELARSIALTAPRFIVTSEELRPAVLQALALCSEQGTRAASVLADDIPDEKSLGFVDAAAGGVQEAVGRTGREGAARASMPALNIFTGGTTGVPKAVVHTYGALSYHLMSNMIRTPHARFSPYDVTLSSAPLFHIGGLDILLGCLARGGTLVLTTGFDMDAMTELALRESVTTVVLIPPTLIERLSRVQDARREKITHIEHVIVSGGACSTEIARKIFATVPHACITAVYGMSEHVAALWMSFTRRDFEADSDVANVTGKTNFLYDVKLVGGDGNEVAPGAVGELYGRSPCMLERYYGGETSFTEDGYLPTGDLFSIDERGFYHFHARSKDAIKSGGENVYAVEVEDALMAHPAVAECAVVGIPDDFYGEAVAAAVVLRDGCVASAEELIACCKERIASYKKPRRVLFVDELPKTSIGKVLKTEVRRLFAGE